MRMTFKRMQIIDCMRLEGRAMGAAEIAALLGHNLATLYRALTLMEGHNAVKVDRSSRPFKYALRPEAYVMRGTFPPKGEI